ncbi:MAG: fibronectin type III domain-containing protein [Chthonomonas sp.]|nr:fibronectin type III domain-containing protein [Chthonomonas sp.]
MRNSPRPPSPDVLESLSSIVKRIYSDPNVDDKMLRDAGLAERPGKPQYLTPNVPLDATSNVVGPRAVEIRWKRNGNVSPTVYIIEQQTPSGWVQIASETATKFVHNNIDAGVMQTYRVTAKRGNRFSPASNEATIWATNGGVELRVAA